MKPIFNLIFILVFIAANISVFGQDKKELAITELLKKCGCNQEVNSPNLPNITNEINVTFGNNAVVHELFTNISASPIQIVKKNISKWLKSAMSKDKNEEWTLLKDSLIVSSTNLVNEEKAEDFIKAETICSIANQLHLYYINHLDEFSESAAQRKFYESLSLVPMSNDSAKTLSDSSKQNVEQLKNKEKVDGGGFSISMILALLASLLAGLFAYLWYQEKTKYKKLTANLTDTEKELQGLEKTKAEKMSNFQVEKAKLEQEINELKSSLYSKDLTISGLQYELSKIKTNTLEGPQIPIGTKIYRYLFAPSQEGTFFQNSVKETLSSDTFYKLTLAKEADVEAKFELIKDPELLNRAEAMAQEYLLSACELQGKGKINLSTLQITPGLVRREGSGWRIVKKVVLRW
jgi:hypothetical protein